MKIIKNIYKSIIKLTLITTAVLTQTIKITPKQSKKIKIKSQEESIIRLEEYFDILGPIWNPSLKLITTTGRKLESKHMKILPRIVKVHSKGKLKFDENAFDKNRKLVHWTTQREYFGSLFYDLKQSGDTSMTYFQFFQKDKNLANFEVDGKCLKLTIVEGSKQSDEDFLEVVSLCKKVKSGGNDENFIEFFSVKDKNTTSMARIDGFDHNFSDLFRAVRFSDDIVILFYEVDHIITVYLMKLPSGKNYLSYGDAILDTITFKNGKLNFLYRNFQIFNFKGKNFNFFSRGKF